MELKAIIAKRIRLARVERGWNQSTLAEAIASNQKYISRVESGKLNMSIDRLNQIAQALNKPIEYFFQKFDQVESEFPTELELPAKTKRKVARKTRQKSRTK